MSKNIKLLAYSIAIVYIWFGLLKIMGQSPVAELVRGTHPWLPEPAFLISLGVVEVVIGLLLLFSKTRRAGVLLMWLQLVGIFGGAILKSSLYINGGSILLLNTAGEFVIKNIVFVAAGWLIYKEEL